MQYSNEEAAFITKFPGHSCIEFGDDDIIAEFCAEFQEKFGRELPVEKFKVFFAKPANALCVKIDDEPYVKIDVNADDDTDYSDNEEEHTKVPEVKADSDNEDEHTKVPEVKADEADSDNEEEHTGAPEVKADSDNEDAGDSDNEECNEVPEVKIDKAPEVKLVFIPFTIKGYTKEESGFLIDTYAGICKFPLWKLLECERYEDPFDDICAKFEKKFGRLVKKNDMLAIFKALYVKLPFSGAKKDHASMSDPTEDCDDHDDHDDYYSRAHGYRAQPDDIYQ